MDYLFKTRTKLDLHIMPRLIAVLVVDEEHQQDGCLNFDGSHDFDLNLEASDQRQEMQQVIGKLMITTIVFIYFTYYTALDIQRVI